MASASLVIFAALLGFAVTGVYMRAAAAACRLRATHAAPVPSGAGLAIVAVALVLWCMAQNSALEGTHVLLVGGACVLSVVSWFDDHRPLSPLLRLATHAGVVVLVLASIGPDQRILPALPLLVERIALGFAWLWFINLFNFMDGIDGLAGSEAIAVAAGYAALLATVGIQTPLSDLALIVGAAAAGYLVWNWHPAKVLMGDAGSIPLGFLLGWLMIDLAYRGFWPAAFILPLYFAADATLTLLKRLLRGKTPWHRHREHFYQRAVSSGAPVAAVVLCVSAANIVLLVLALSSVRYPSLSLLGAVVMVGSVLAFLTRWPGKRPTA